jgi:hypothetical protein
VTAPIRRAGITLAAAATLVATSVGGAAAQPTTDDPTDAAAGWLTTQLTDGDHILVEFDGDEFPDPGLTADVVYALAAAGVGGDHLEAAAGWLTTQTETYQGPGATAKLILALDVAGDDVRDVGGVDLVAGLTALENEDGLYEGEWNSTLNQSLALLALARADETPSDDAVALLLDPRC